MAGSTRRDGARNGHSLRFLSSPRAAPTSTHSLLYDHHILTLKQGSPVQVQQGPASKVKECAEREYCETKASGRDCSGPSNTQVLCEWSPLLQSQPMVGKWEAGLMVLGFLISQEKPKIQPFTSTISILNIGNQF